MGMEKRIYRSKTNRVIGGVCGGMGDYFGIDPVLIRLLWVGSILLAGAGILFYLIAWVVIPEEKVHKTDSTGSTPFTDYDSQSHFDANGSTSYAAGTSGKAVDSKKGSLVIAILFLFIGLFLLLNRFFAIFSWKIFIGIVFIFLGGVFLYGFFKEVRK
jgi:phage shock protein C